MPSLLLALAACAPAPDASEDFSDAAQGALAHFDDADPTEVIAAVLALEAQVDAAVDTTAEDFNERGMTPGRLEARALVGLTRPDRDPALGTPVTLSWLSPYPPSQHDSIVLLDDLTPVEPASPEQYDRTFAEGRDCYPTTCEFARTTNVVIRENLLFTMEQVVKKDFRSLDAEGRALRVSRGWFEAPESNAEGTATIEQSYTIELWLEQGQGALRVQVTWVETVFTEFEADDALVAATLRLGIDGQFDAHDAWLAEQAAAD